ncbi:MAG: phosphoglycerate kinase [Candidatus Bipolaricaulia bacterium]
MAKKTLDNIDVRDRRVLVRVDFNVPLSDGAVADDTRIRAALPTIQHLIEAGARVVLCSHLGRPKGQRDASLSLRPAAERLSELIGQDVATADDCVGSDVETQVEGLRSGQVLLLENTRFHAEEKRNDANFAQQLAKLADVYVNDAFGAAHRADASTEGVAHHVETAVMGRLMEEELHAIAQVTAQPERPLVAVLGGAKISDKMGVLDRLQDRADTMLVGGGMANTLLKAKGVDVGASMVENDVLNEAERLIDDLGEDLVLPTDAVVAPEVDANADRRTVAIDDLPDDWHILDIGPQTVTTFNGYLRDAMTVVWNGPMGVFELEPFAEGTFAIARTMAELNAITVVGGGESGAAIYRADVVDQLTHVSTGGGAFLTLLEGSELPGVAVLDERRADPAY